MAKAEASGKKKLKMCRKIEGQGKDTGRTREVLFWNTASASEESRQNGKHTN